MNVIADLCVVPIGVGVSLSTYVAACEDVLKQTRLKTTLHPNGTAIEGQWDEVMAVVRRCHQALEQDCARIVTTMKIDYRKGTKPRMAAKIDAVEAKAGRPLQK